MPTPFTTGEANYSAIGSGGTGTGDMVSTNNLSDVANVATSRTNLGLGTAATAAATSFCAVANNLSDVASVDTSRQNLDVPFSVRATKSGNFSVQTTENGYYYEWTVGAADYTCTLPNASSVVDGFIVSIKKVDSNTGAGLFTGTGLTNPKTLYFQSDTITFRSNGTTWEVLSYFSRCCTRDDFFGDGSAGDVTVSGSVTLTDNVYYNTVTFSTGAALTCSGYIIFVKHWADFSNAPAGSIISNAAAGGNASGATAGAAGSAILGSYIGGAATTPIVGASGGTGVGAQATNIPASATYGPAGTNNTTAVTSGAGGSGGAGAGGAARTGTASSIPGRIPYHTVNTQIFRFMTASTMCFIQGGAAGQAGSSGAGDSTNSGGGGGGSGKGGGYVMLIARKIIRGASTAANTIQANAGKGGNGGNASTGNCGGGGGAGGGAGGVIHIQYGELIGATGTNMLQAKGADGGTGGNGVGTGTVGNGGYSGGSGRIFVFNILSSSVTTDSNGSAPAANSGQTAGTAAEHQANL